LRAVDPSKIAHNLKVFWNGGWLRVLGDDPSQTLVRLKIKWAAARRPIQGIHFILYGAEEIGCSRH